MRLALVLVAAVACGPSSRSGTDATSSGGDSVQAGACYEPSVTGMVMAGQANIQDCAIWNSVAMMTGDVTLTRSGDNLTMAFSTGITFTGTVTGSQVTLTYSHLHDFTDGCKWRATETLDGTLDPATCVMTLAYNYVETVEIDNGGCATPCTGTADFSLQITPIF